MLKRLHQTKIFSSTDFVFFFVKTFWDKVQSTQRGLTLPLENSGWVVDPYSLLGVSFLCTSLFWCQTLQSGETAVGSHILYPLILFCSHPDPPPPLLASGSGAQSALFNSSYTRAANLPRLFPLPLVFISSMFHVYKNALRYSPLVWKSDIDNRNREWSEAEHIHIHRCDGQMPSNLSPQSCENRMSASGH